MKINLSCPHLGCRHHLGLAASDDKVREVCPTHGTVAWIDRRKLNGFYDTTKIGGSGGD